MGAHLGFGAFFGVESDQIEPKFDAEFEKND